MRLGIRGRALSGVGALLAAYALLLAGLQWSVAVRDECVSRLFLNARYEFAVSAVDLEASQFLASARPPRDSRRMTGLKARISARLKGLEAMAELLPLRRAGAGRLSAAFSHASLWLAGEKSRMADRMFRAAAEQVVMARLKSGKDLDRVAGREESRLLLEKIEATSEAIFWFAWAAMAMTCLLGVLGTYWFTNYLLRNIQGLKSGLVRAAADGLPAPLPLESADEMGALVSAFNDLAQTLADSRAHWSQPGRPARFDKAARTAAHMINNPLTAIIGYAELLMRADLGEGVKKDLLRIREQAERCHRAVESLTAAAQAPAARP